MKKLGTGYRNVAFREPETARLSSMLGANNYRRAILFPAAGQDCAFETRHLLSRRFTAAQFQSILAMFSRARHFASEMALNLADDFIVNVGWRFLNNLNFKKAANYK